MASTASTPKPRSRAVCATSRSAPVAMPATIRSSEWGRCSASCRRISVTAARSCGKISGRRSRCPETPTTKGETAPFLLLFDKAWVADGIAGGYSRQALCRLRPGCDNGHIHGTAGLALLRPSAIDSGDRKAFGPPPLTERPEGGLLHQDYCLGFPQVPGVLELQPPR